MRLSIVLLSLLIGLAACSETAPPPRGALVLPDGRKHSLTDYQGRWLVINYWATWCKPCLKEIPHFNRLHQERSGDVAVFGVDFDNSQGAALAERINTMGIAFPTLLQDPAAGLDHARPHVLPTTVIYNPQGKLATILLGDQSWESLNKALSP